MSSLYVASQASFIWSLYAFWEKHSLISIVIFLFLLRYALRWFFGLTKIREAQNRYKELLEEHTSLLKRQNQMLEEHESVLIKLENKYL